MWVFGVLLHVYCNRHLFWRIRGLITSPHIIRELMVLAWWIGSFRNRHLTFRELCIRHWEQIVVFGCIGTKMFGRIMFVSLGCPIVVVDAAPNFECIMINPWWYLFLQSFLSPNSSTYPTLFGAPLLTLLIGEFVTASDTSPEPSHWVHELP